LLRILPHFFGKKTHNTTSIAAFFACELRVFSTRLIRACPAEADVGTAAHAARTARTGAEAGAARNKSSNPNRQDNTQPNKKRRAENS
jgi:hypothetical protein